MTSNRDPNPPQYGESVADYEFIQLSTAVESREQAETLVRAVVQQRLSAGAQVVGPVMSAFWHRGEFGMGEEWQILLKTHASRYATIESFLIEHHPWDNPEVSAVPIVAGSAGYLGWLRASVIDADAADG